MMGAAVARQKWWKFTSTHTRVTDQMLNTKLTNQLRERFSLLAPNHFIFCVSRKRHFLF